jgi:hypothetical protein
VTKDIIDRISRKAFEKKPDLRPHGRRMANQGRLQAADGITRNDIHSLQKDSKD